MEEMSIEELEEELIEKRKLLAQVELDLAEEESKGGLLQVEIDELEHALNIDGEGEKSIMPVNDKDAELKNDADISVDGPFHFEIGPKSMGKLLKSTSTKEYRDKMWGDYKPNVFKQEVLGEFVPYPEQMRVDFIPRGSGRTKAYVEWVKQAPNHIVVVATEQDRRKIIDRGDVPYEQILTTYMAKDRGFLRELAKDVEFWIDEAEEVIKSHFGRRVAGISLTDHYPEKE